MESGRSNGPERVRFFRACAARAREEADRITYPEIREIYFELAERWDRRAAAIN